MKNNYIAIIVALNYEISNLKYEHKKIKIGNQTYFLINNKIILLFTGIGKTNSSYKTALLFSNFNNINNVINIGSCGSVNPFMDILSINIANECQYGDVDVSCDPKFEINQIPYEKKYFKTDETVLKVLNDIASHYNYKYTNGKAMTVDSFVTLNNLNAFKESTNPDVYSLDMECAAIAHVCDHLKVPFNCVKVVSDNPLANNNHFNFESNMQSISIMIANIVNGIIDYYLNLY